RTGRGDPVHRDPRDGARALRAGGQGRLPAQRGLGGGSGGRFHVAPRVLSAGLLRGWPGTVPVPPLQGRQPAHETRLAHLSGDTGPYDTWLVPHRGDIVPLSGVSAGANDRSGFRVGGDAMASSGGVQSVERVLDLLEAMADAGGATTLSDLAASSGL